MAADHFATLELPRQPWLEEEQVRDRFQQLAASTHPDAGGGDLQRFVTLNTAWHTLRSPTARLRHYLELEHPEVLHAGRGIIPAADLFMSIAEAQQRAGAVGAQLAEAKSPLARAMLEPQRIVARKQLELLAATVATETQQIHAQLRAGERTPPALAAALNQLAFLEKWSAQLGEHALTLS